MSTSVSNDGLFTSSGFLMKCLAKYTPLVSLPWVPPTMATLLTSPVGKVLRTFQSISAIWNQSTYCQRMIYHTNETLEATMA
mmetsp:Transcript_54221/g.129208  ORF Transcript_54221/g.129208 Transcript_54221/m.129208 type:complete len:82 (+) Transcript_54221:1139-1384(+)